MHSASWWLPLLSGAAALPQAVPLAAPAVFPTSLIGPIIPQAPSVYGVSGCVYLGFYISISQPSVPGLLGTVSSLTGSTIQLLSGAVSTLQQFGGVSWQTCNQYCAQGGFKYAGIEGGNTCRCGNNFGFNPVRAADSICGLTCSGSSAQCCGALNRILLFQITNPILAAAPQPALPALPAPSAPTVPSVPAIPAPAAPTVPIVPKPSTPAVPSVPAVSPSPAVPKPSVPAVSPPVVAPLPSSGGSGLPLLGSLPLAGGLPSTGSLTNALPGTGSLPSTGSLTNALPGTGSLPSTGSLTNALPGTGSLPSTGSLTNVLPGTGSLPSTGSLTNALPGTGSLPSTGSLTNILPGTGSLPSTGSLTNVLPVGSVLPTTGLTNGLPTSGLTSALPGGLTAPATKSITSADQCIARLPAAVRQAIVSSCFS